MKELKGRVMAKLVEIVIKKGSVMELPRILKIRTCFSRLCKWKTSDIFDEQQFDLQS